ncbi:MAG: HEPN domain-containing protein [Promethearchaeota archaeon]
MHEEEIKLLQKRALNFLDSAKERFQKEDWDLVCFMAEQAVQLFLKSLILKEIGEIPKTHSIRKLLGIINQIKEQNIKFERKELLFLENAY